MLELFHGDVEYYRIMHQFGQAKAVPSRLRSLRQRKQTWGAFIMSSVLLIPRILYHFRANMRQVQRHLRIYQKKHWILFQEVFYLLLVRYLAFISLIMYVQKPDFSNTESASSDKGGQQ